MRAKRVEGLIEVFPAREYGMDEDAVFVCVEWTGFYNSVYDIKLDLMDAFECDYSEITIFDVARKVSGMYAYFIVANTIYIYNTS